MEPSAYQIVKKLATGGMAEIFLAKRASPEGEDHEFVLKRILPEHADDPTFIESFLNEAKLAGQLRHPNIVQIYDLGQLGKTYFIAMEYIRGFDVTTILYRGRQMNERVPLGVALRIFCDVCAGLDFAHDAKDIDGHPLGVVHRDVTPSNVLVSMNGPAKIVDFGIAKATTRNEGKTKTGTIKGKFSYLSPEQVLGTPLDRRSDVFSAGIMLVELLTGDNPFRAENDYHSLQRIVTMETPRVTGARPELPPVFDEIVAKVLHRDLAQRFASCGELLQAVERASAAAGIALRHEDVREFLERNEEDLSALRVQIHDESEAMDGATRLEAEEPAPPPPPRYGLWAAGAVLIVALVVVGLYALRQRGTAGATLEPTEPSIEIVSDPAGAQVLINGVLVTGTTPLRLDEVEAGKTYKLELVKKGHRAARAEVTLDTPGVRKVQVALAEANAPAPKQPPAQGAKNPPSRPEHAPPTPAAPVSNDPGKLRVTVVPWGIVTIDGHSMGETPFPPRELAPGEHVVIIENGELAKRITRKVKVSSGQESSLRVDLTKE